MGRRHAVWLATLATVVCGCAARADEAPPPAAPPPSPVPVAAQADPSSPDASAKPPRAAATAAATPAPAPVREALLSRGEARRFMVELINRDRASMGLRPVELDDGPPSRAGQRHADDMASHAYLGHWGTDGSVPEQRFTEAGGVDMVLENASCYVDGRPRTLDPSARIDRRNIEMAEAMFFHEKPPNDGHRQNILKPWHTKVGVGVAQPVATATEIPVPCFSQEFVDTLGHYEPVPKAMRVGDVLHAEGTITAPATFAGVGLARVDEPHPLSVSELNARRSYPVPTPYLMLWPPGYKTPIPVQVDAKGHFAVDVPVSDNGRPGLYELSVWASVPRSKDFVMSSLRTFTVRSR